MTAKDLKASILQLAIQGKLVPQDSNDEPADALLERIRENRGADFNTEAQRHGGRGRSPSAPHGRARTPAAPLPVTDEEKPFDLPDGWAWCRLGEIATLKGGFAFKSNEYKDSGVQVVRISDLLEDAVGTKDAVFYHEDASLSGYLIPDGSILICLTGSIGKMAFVKDGVKRYLNQRVGMLSVEADLREYVWQFLHTQGVFLTWMRNKTSTNGNLKNSDVTDIVVPLPPIAEQKRIVAKIEELMPMVERYGAAKAESDALEAALPDAFRKSVLQYAVQGKLVPQDPNDEPADALLERICKVKVRGEGEQRNSIRIGRGRSPSAPHGRARTPSAPLPVTDEEKPFDLPDGWAWCRLGEIGTTNIGLTYRPGDVAAEGVPVLRSNNIQNGRLCLDGLVRVKVEVPERTFAHTNDILICARNGSKALVGKSAIVDSEGMSFGAFMTILRTPFYKYAYCFLSSECFRAQLTDSNTTTINQITQDKLKNIVIPLPPLAEQKRIVTKIEELLAMEEKIKAAL